MNGGGCGYCREYRFWEWIYSREDGIGLTPWGSGGGRKLSDKMPCSHWILEGAGEVFRLMSLVLGLGTCSPQILPLFSQQEFYVVYAQRIRSQASPWGRGRYRYTRWTQSLINPCRANISAKLLELLLRPWCSKQQWQVHCFISLMEIHFSAREVKSESGFCQGILNSFYLKIFNQNNAGKNLKARIVQTNKNWFFLCCSKDSLDPQNWGF